MSAAPDLPAISFLLPKKISLQPKHWTGRSECQMRLWDFTRSRQ